MNKKRIRAIALSAILSAGLAGCIPQELSADVSNVAILTTNDEETGKTLNQGVAQEKDIQGEKFKLSIHYLSGEDTWRITSNKKLYFEIKTLNLPDNLAVYIDNIHMDTSIVSTKAAFDGIMQDTMDDRIHNSLMLGFPIDNERSYFGVNEIEGQNDSFISGYSYGNAYYHGGSVYQRRYLVSDYLKDGVWANKVDVVIDLLICDKTTGEVLRQVSVDSNLLIEVNDKVTFLEKGDYVTYDYDRDGSKKEIKRVKKND